MMALRHDFFFDILGYGRKNLIVYYALAGIPSITVGGAIAEGLIRKINLLRIRWIGAEFQLQILFLVPR